MARLTRLVVLIKNLDRRTWLDRQASDPDKEYIPFMVLRDLGVQRTWLDRLIKTDRHG